MDPLTPQHFRTVNSVGAKSRLLCEMVANGYNNFAITKELKNGEQVVKNDLSRIYEKIGCNELFDRTPRALLTWWWLHVGKNLPEKKKESVL